MNTTTNTRGVSEAMVEAKAREMYEAYRTANPDARMFPWEWQTFKPTRDHWRFKAIGALEAALSAEPAAQAEEEFDVRKYVRHMADVLEAGGDLFKVDADLLRLAAAINKAANTAPPAQPAEVEATLRRILERGKHRTDGDLVTLLDRVEHMTRGDQDLIAMQRTEIRLLDEKAARPAERVPEGEVRLWDTQWLNIVNHDNCYRDWDKADAINHAVKMTEQAIARNVADGKLPKTRAASPAPSPARGDGGE